MLKKVVLASAVAIASLISFNLGARTPSVSAPPNAAACVPVNCGGFWCYPC
jgi:hypothetical protein